MKIVAYVNEDESSLAFNKPVGGNWQPLVQLPPEGYALVSIESLATMEAFKNVPTYVFNDDEGDDGCVEEIKQIDEDNLSINAKSGYCDHVGELASIKNTGNGFIMHVPSYTHMHQDNYICMGYDEADYLRKLLNYIHNKGL